MARTTVAPALAGSRPIMKNARASTRRSPVGRATSKDMTQIALEILKKASSNDPPTIDWVRERFEVTERQAFRYLQHAKQAGMELVAERRPDGRTIYRLPATAYFKPEQLSVSEAIATAVLTNALLGQPLQPDSATARSGVDKIQKALDRRVSERIQHLQSRLSVRMVQAERPAQPKVFHTLVDAILGDVTVRVEYASPYQGASGKQSARGGQSASASGKTSTNGAGTANGKLNDKSNAARRIETFELEPYALVFARRSWYLVARRVASADVRTYKLGRFTHVSTTGTRFAMPRDFSVDSHLGNAWELVRAHDSKSLPVELVFDPSFAGAIADTRWHRTQKLTPLPDGSVRFEARVDGTQEILWWILGMGSHVRVVGPPQLVDAVREETLRMQAVHAGAAKPSARKTGKSAKPAVSPARRARTS